MVPEVPVAITINSDVPLATKSLAPTSTTNSGTTMTPPPMPSSPDITPVNNPRATSPAPNTQSTSTTASRAGTTMNSDAMTSSMNTMNPHRTTRCDNTVRSHEPIGAPTMEPAASNTAISRFTLPSMA